jgi:RNA ligase
MTAIDDALPVVESVQDIARLAQEGFEDWALLGDVSVKRKGNLLLFSYTPSAQYAGRWNFFERVSRGLIINRRTGEIVARPFDKFFNWGEGGRKAPYTAHIVNVYEKLDGSLGIFYRDNGYKIATRGSFPSTPQEVEDSYNEWARKNKLPEQNWAELVRYGAMTQWSTLRRMEWQPPASLASTWATEHLKQHDLPGLPDELTLLFEILYPHGRILIDYGDREELVLLAARNRHTGEYLPFYPDVYEMAQRYGFSTPRTYHFSNVTDILAQAGQLDYNQEGWVVEFSNGERYKIKGDAYLELNRLVSGLSFRSTLQAVMEGRVEQSRQLIPEEFLTEFNGWVETIGTKVEEVKNQVEQAYQAAPQASRKDFALWVQQNHRDLAPYLFALADGRPIEPLIYKMAFRDDKS